MHAAAIGVRTHHVDVDVDVDVGAGGEVVRMARAHFQLDGHRGRPVDQVVAVAGAFRECRYPLDEKAA